MIRHRPHGSGHPYSIDTDQRSPVQPVAGEPLMLGVRTSGSIAAVTAELVGAERHEILALKPASSVSRGRPLDGGHLASAQARVARSAGGWQVAVGGLTAGQAYRYRFTATREDGRIQRTRWFDFRVAAWRPVEGGIAVHGDSRLVPGSVTALDDGERIHRVRFSIEVDPGEHVAGLGERFDAIDHRGTRLDSVVFEQYKNQGAERKTYFPMPFAHIVGGRGWGFHVRTSRRVWFDLGAATANEIVVESEVDAPSQARELLSVVFYDGSPTAVLDAFLDEVGRPRELPDWVFRLWASANEWNTQAEVMKQVELHREHDIPIGSVVIEAWSDESTFTAWRDAQYVPRADGGPLGFADFAFPEDGAWPDPKGMVDELHRREIRLLLWQIPLIKMRPHPRGQAKADAEAAIREGYLVQEPAPDGSFRPYRNRGWWFPLALMPDLGDEQAASWWVEKRRYLVEEMGVDGFKTDGGEHAWGRELRYLDGSRGDEGNNLFPVHYARAYGDLLESAGKAPVTFSRAGFTGSQAHGAFWAGDENSTWEAFRWSLFAGLSAAASGVVYWGWDIGGFSGDVPDGELYLRSAAAAAFAPIMQYHAEFNHHRIPSGQRTPWNVAERNGDDRVIPVFRRFVHLRERLVPYLTEQASTAIRDSAPLMRPLYFDYPHDERLWEHPQQWLLGDDLLVSPVTEPGATEWATYLPAGEWVDAWSGELQSGTESGRVVTRPAPIDEIPVYIRASASPRLRNLFVP